MSFDPPVSPPDSSSPVPEMAGIGVATAANPDAGKLPSDSAPAPNIWPAVLAAGLLAGLCSWAVGEYTVKFFAPAKVWKEMWGTYQWATTLETMADADVQNAALAFGIQGAALGMLLGLAGGLSRRSPARAARAALVGLLLGAGAGAGVCGTVLPLFDIALDRFRNDILTCLLMHGTLWAPVGAIGGLALGMGLGGRDRIVRALAGALLGTVLAVVIYELMGALVFSSARSGVTRPISATWETRLLARLLLAVGAAAGAAIAAHRGRRDLAAERNGPGGS